MSFFWEAFPINTGGRVADSLRRHCETKQQFPDEAFDCPEMLEAFRTCQPYKCYQEGTNNYEICHTTSKSPRFIRTSLGTRLVVQVKSEADVGKYYNCFVLSPEDIEKGWNLVACFTKHSFWEIYLCRRHQVPRDFDGSFAVRYI